MPVLSVDTSFVCELYYDGAGNVCSPETPGASQCLGLMMVDHVLPYDHTLKGKIQHRKCERCGSKRDALVSWLGNSFVPGRIDTTGGDNSPTLFDKADYLSVSE